MYRGIRRLTKEKSPHVQGIISKKRNLLRAHPFFSTGLCRHGTYLLRWGGSQSVSERRAGPMWLIVRWVDNFQL